MHRSRKNLFEIVRERLISLKSNPEQAQADARFWERFEGEFGKTRTASSSRPWAQILRFPIAVAASLAVVIGAIGLLRRELPPPSASVSEVQAGALLLDNREFLASVEILAELDELALDATDVEWDVLVHSAEGEGNESG
ncbi:MAG: hypothetical protein A2X94_17025 [Bdellovibrionales bacterium GWB1_55_8]|nr:MAG: hypothetical protein A2X94_17025 [Bdellovibrionales bacterium GWB1_55_8]